MKAEFVQDGETMGHIVVRDDEGVFTMNTPVTNIADTKNLAVRRAKARLNILKAEQAELTRRTERAQAILDALEAVENTD